MCIDALCTNMVPPIFKIFNFLRISPLRSTFSKKFLTFPQPEAHFIFCFNFSPGRSTFHFSFLTFPQPEAHPETHFLTFPQPEAHPKMQFLTFPQPEAHPKMQFLTFPQPEADFQKKNLKISPTTGFLVRILTSSRNWLKIQDTQDKKMQKICPYMDKCFWAIFAIKLGKIGIFEQNVGSRCPNLRPPQGLIWGPPKPSLIRSDFRGPQINPWGAAN